MTLNSISISLSSMTNVVQNHQLLMSPDISPATTLQAIKKLFKQNFQ